MLSISACVRFGSYTASEACEGGCAGWRLGASVCGAAGGGCVCGLAGGACVGARVGMRAWACMGGCGAGTREGVRVCVCVGGGAVWSSVRLCVGAASRDTLRAVSRDTSRAVSRAGALASPRVMSRYEGPSASTSRKVRSFRRPRFTDRDRACALIRWRVALITALRIGHCCVRVLWCAGWLRLVHTRHTGSAVPGHRL